MIRDGALSLVAARTVPLNVMPIGVVFTSPHVNVGTSSTLVNINAVFPLSLSINIVTFLRNPLISKPFAVLYLVVPSAPVIPVVSVGLVMLAEE